MKFFVPVSALALAVASNLVQHASAAACTATDVCPTGTTCLEVTAGTTAKELKSSESGLTCATGKFAYLSGLQVVPDVTTGSVTDAANIEVKLATDGTTYVAVTKSAGAAACDNTYENIGKTSVTANSKVSIGCPSGTTNCKFKYKAMWACQQTACAAADVCPSGTTCPEVADGKTATVLERPATTVLAACDTGKYAYVSALQIVPDATAPATDASNVMVSASIDDGTTYTAVTKNVGNVCDSTYADLGKATTTKDAKVKLMCPSGTTNCKFKYKVTWACQTAATPAPASGVASLLGASSAVVWGTAMAAAVAGANL